MGFEDDLGTRRGYWERKGTDRSNNFLVFSLCLDLVDSNIQLL
jgi:hypothetical protein